MTAPRSWPADHSGQLPSSCPADCGRREGNGDEACSERRATDPISHRSNCTLLHQRKAERSWRCARDTLTSESTALSFATGSFAKRRSRLAVMMTSGRSCCEVGVASVCASVSELEVLSSDCRHAASTAPNAAMQMLRSRLNRILLSMRLMVTSSWLFHSLLAPWMLHSLYDTAKNSGWRFDNSRALSFKHGDRTINPCRQSPALLRRLMFLRSRSAFASGDGCSTAARRSYALSITGIQIVRPPSPVLGSNVEL